MLWLARRARCGTRHRLAYRFVDELRQRQGSVVLTRASRIYECDPHCFRLSLERSITSVFSFTSETVAFAKRGPFIGVVRNPLSKLARRDSSPRWIDSDGLLCHASWPRAPHKYSLGVLPRRFFICALQFDHRHNSIRRVTFATRPETVCSGQAG